MNPPVRSIRHVHTGTINDGRGISAKRPRPRPRAVYGKKKQVEEVAEEGEVRTEAEGPAAGVNTGEQA